MGLCLNAEDEPECLDNAEGFLRENPEREQIMERVATRILETNIDIEWAGGIAPNWIR